MSKARQIMGSSRLDCAAPETWAYKAMEHLQEAWETVHYSLSFCDKEQLLNMKNGVDKMSSLLAKEIADFHSRPQDDNTEDADSQSEEET